MYKFCFKKDEKYSYDGFTHRIEFAAPPPHKHTDDDMFNAPPRIVTVSCIIYFIHCLHEKQRLSTYSEEVRKLLGELYNRNQQIIHVSNTIHYFKLVTLSGGFSAKNVPKCVFNIRKKKILGHT